MGFGATELKVAVKYDFKTLFDGKVGHQFTIIEASENHTIIFNKSDDIYYQP